MPVSVSLDEGIDAVLHVRRARLRAEMARATGTGQRSSWLAGVAAGRPRHLRRLASALRTYHEHALAPFRDQILHQAEAHRRAVTQCLAGGGVHALLGNLGAGIRWNPPVLSAPYPADLTVDLAGRGLTLIPSFFCRGAPVTLANVELDPILVYPLDPPQHWMQPDHCGDGVDRHLATLIGRPRTALLRALTSPAGTSQLAARTGMSLSSASEHTAILRNCGLVASTRNGRHVVHSLTPLGRHVLAGGLPVGAGGKLT
ncbi:ArsR/SmtB family transcription factor [Nonomuraea sp. KM88]|uniref:ArsR/SmtB family transcription factor n=1 Tax=Nonomuraea sp. KM88 TaxID=3457427 RepID=UPI003FCDF52F